MTVATGLIRVSPREYCLVAERLLQHAGLDRGIVVPLRETTLDAELATGTTLHYLLEHADRIAACAPAALPVTTDGPAVDGHGAPALLLLPAVLDAARRHGSLVVRNVHGADQLAALAVTGLRHGVRVRVDVGDESRVTTEGSSTDHSAAEFAAGGPERRRAVTAGIPVDAALWWAAYRRSNLALSVDTRTSRRHAGATIVEDDGTLRGAVDDEIDHAIYSGDRAALFDESVRERSGSDLH